MYHIYSWWQWRPEGLKPLRVELGQLWTATWVLIPEPRASVWAASLQPTRWTPYTLDIPGTVWFLTWDRTESQDKCVLFSFLVFKVTSYSPPSTVWLPVFTLCVLIRKRSLGGCAFYLPSASHWSWPAPQALGPAPQCAASLFQSVVVAGCWLSPHMWQAPLIT